MANAIKELIDKVRMLGVEVSLESVLYPYRKAYYGGKFAQVRGTQQSRGSVWRGLAALASKSDRDEKDPTYLFAGRLLAYHWQHGQRIELTAENAMAHISVLAPDLIRVRVSPSGRLPPPFSYAVCKADEEWAPVELDVEEQQDHLMIRTAKLHCRVNKADMAITFLDPDGTIINADAAGVGWQQGSEKVLCWKHMPPGEHLYGLGQKTTRLDKQGLAFEMWNRDPQFYSPGEDPIYSNIPFYQGLVGGRAYGVFYDNSARGRFDFGAQTPGITRFEAECGEMRYYFTYGPELATVLDRYTELTGRMAMPPLWTLGYHQNRWSYYPEARVREVARQFRERRIPCEAIHLDIDYMDGFRCFTWDEGRFPDPAGLVRDLHADGFHVVAMIDPGIKVDPRYWVYRDGLQQGVFCTYPDGTPFKGPVWPGECCFPDFTSPRVRSWWGELYRGMTDLDVDGFWNDMNEPAVMSPEGETFPDIVQHEWEGLGADHRTAHNVYGMQMARATAEGLAELRPDERPWVISRSVWAGSQRYNMHWLGDNRSDWASLRNGIQLVLNMGLSGIAFTGPDTGGFDGTPTGELLVRWNQLGVFTPFFRNHTAKNTKDQEPWAFGEECERISRQFIELRYHLLPYLYTAFWQSAQRGLPMMRPLVLAFQDDPHVPGIDDQFMFGDAFLVAPVVDEGATSRRVYLPRGRWVDFWEGTLTAGPQITRLVAPLDRLPLLVRAGSVVPAWPVMQYTGERPVDQLVLHVYPGDGEGWLYEDDGHTWAFREGEQRVTRLVSALRPSQSGTASKTLCLERHAEGPFVPPYQRIQVAVHGVTSAPRDISVDGEGLDAPLFDQETRTARFETGLFQTLEMTID
jgi:alpha-glucosidase